MCILEILLLRKFVATNTSDVVDSTKRVVQVCKMIWATEPGSAPVCASVMIWPTLVKNWENWVQVGNQCFERSVVTGGPPLQARLNTNGAIITIILTTIIVITVFMCFNFQIPLHRRHWIDSLYDLIGIFSSWAIQIYKLVIEEKQEFHIRYNKQTTMVENRDHLL